MSQKHDNVLAELESGQPRTSEVCQIGQWLSKFPEEVSARYAAVILDAEAWPSAQALYDTLVEKNIGFPGKVQLFRKHRRQDCLCYRKVQK